MIDHKTALRTLLIGNVALTTLVPAARIYFIRPAKIADIPCITFEELDNSLTDEDYRDDQPGSESVSMQIDVWCKPNTSTTAIAQAVDNVLIPAMYNRDYAQDFVEPDSGIIHKVMRYSKRVFY